jgi:hypothetical protein
MSIINGCPFCGEIPEIHRWHGGGPRKTMIACTNTKCPVQPQHCAATRAKAVAEWSKRPRHVNVTSAQLIPYTEP